MEPREPDDKLSQPVDSFTLIAIKKMSVENQKHSELANELLKNSVLNGIIEKFNNENIKKNHPLAEEIENSVRELVKENAKLKEVLQQSNVAMKQQFTSLIKWFEEVFLINQNYKRKFEETKDLVLKLKSENSELKKPIQEAIRSIEARSMSERNKLSVENKLLEEELSVTQQKLRKLEQYLSVNNRSDKEQELINTVASLNKQLENAEKSRRKLTIDVDRLNGQEIKLQRILSNREHRNVTNYCYWNAVFPSPIVSTPREVQVVENLQQHEELLNLLENSNNETIQNLESNYSSRISVIQIESEQDIKNMKSNLIELRNTLFQEQISSANRKEIINNARMNFKDVYKQCLMILKDYNLIVKAQEIKMIDLTEKLKELDHLRNEIGNKQNRIIQLETEYSFLEKKLIEAERKNEDLYVLQSQIRVYEEDFISEREARETLAEEKRVLEYNINCLQQKNKQLLKELHATSVDTSNNMMGIEKSCEPGLNAKNFTCFNETCDESFASEEELQTHIYSCFNIKD